MRIHTRAALGNAPGEPLPEIRVDARPLREKASDAIEALARANEPPHLFVRGGRLVRVRIDERDHPVIEVLGKDELRGVLTRAADFIVDRYHVSPPLDLVSDVLTLGRWPFPALEAVAEAPVLRADGSVLELAGYDAASRLLYRPAPGLVLPPVPAMPTRARIVAARALLLDELLVDFPFVNDASRANAVALIITPIMRPMIFGPVPLALLDKPAPGTGASLFADVVSLIATGRAGAMMSAVRDEEEWRKQITSVLLEGSGFVLIDNVVGRLRSAALARVLTCTTWKDRLLGKNLSLELPQRATWAANGNNILIGGDLARRSYWIRMDARMERPYLRSESKFLHPLPSWAIEHRGEVLAAVLTLVRGWVMARRPQARTPNLGSFGEWARLIGGVLAFSGIHGFLGNADELYDQIDEETSAWETFLATWFSIFGDKAVKVAEIEIEARPKGSTLRQALPGDLLTGIESNNFTASLGYALRSRRDQVIGDFRLEQSARDGHGKVARWRVMRVTTRPVCGKSAAKSTEAFGLAGDAGDNSPRADSRVRKLGQGGISPASPARPG